MKEPLLMSDEEKFRVGTIKQHKEARPARDCPVEGAVEAECFGGGGGHDFYLNEGNWMQ